MYITVIKQSVLLRIAPLGGGQGTRVGNLFILKAPLWGFFVAPTLYLQERC